MGWGSLIGAGISAAGSLFGADESSDAAQAAAQAQVQAAQIASNTQRDFFNQSKNALQPYMDVGGVAMGVMRNRIDDFAAPVAFPTMTQADLANTPGYQFTLNQGLKATQNSAAARGLGVSGAALKGAASYATGLSDQTYNERFGQAQTQWGDQVANQQNAYNRLLGITNVGANAASALAGESTKVGSGIANTQTQSGAAQAAGLNASGQAYAAADKGIGNSFNNALSQYMATNNTNSMWGGYDPASNGGGAYNRWSDNALNGGF